MNAHPLQPSDFALNQTFIDWSPKVDCHRPNLPPSMMFKKNQSRFIYIWVVAYYCNSGRVLEGIMLRMEHLTWKEWVLLQTRPGSSWYWPYCYPTPMSQFPTPEFTGCLPKFLRLFWQDGGFFETMSNAFFFFFKDPIEVYKWTGGYWLVQGKRKYRH